MQKRVTFRHPYLRILLPFVKDVQKVILQSRLYEAGRGNGQFATINNFEIENVSIKSKDNVKKDIKKSRKITLKNDVKERKKFKKSSFEIENVSIKSKDDIKNNVKRIT